MASAGSADRARPGLALIVGFYVVGLLILGEFACWLLDVTRRQSTTCWVRERSFVFLVYKDGAINNWESTQNGLFKKRRSTLTSEFQALMHTISIDCHNKNWATFPLK